MDDSLVETHWTVLKADMKSYKSLETAAIFILANLSETGY